MSSRRVRWFVALAALASLLAFLLARRDEGASPTPGPSGTAPSASGSRVPSAAEVFRVAALRLPQPAAGTPDVPLPDYVPGTRALLLGLSDRASVEILGNRLAATPRGLLAAALDERTTAALIAAFPGLSLRARQVAAWALAQSGGAEATPFLVERLRSEEDPTLRLSLVGALAGRTDPAAEVALAAVVASGPDPATRAAAAAALGSRSGREAGSVAALARGAVEDPDAVVRAACATALGATSEVAAAEALRRAASDADARVRMAAAGALAGLVGGVDDAWFASATEAEPDPSVRAALEDSRRMLRGDLDVSALHGCGGRHAPRRRGR